MCMIAGAVTKDFGVLACDSSMYDTEKGVTNFDQIKMFVPKTGNLALTFIGTYLYLANINNEKLYQPFDSVCLYLKDYFKSQKESIAEQMKEAIKDEDENKPYFCCLLLGLHGGKPVVAQINSFNDFTPKYLYTDYGVKFTSLIYGDDSKPEKKEIFKESTKFMEGLAKDKS